MQVMDIINRAVMKSGVVSNFNPDEVPEDIQQRAADVLRNEIIWDLNCDRAVDVSETVITFLPQRNTVDLITTPQDYSKFIIGSVPGAADYLTEPRALSPAPGAPVFQVPTNLIDLLEQLGYLTKTGGSYFSLAKTDKWVTDQWGNYRDLAMWSDDCKLLEIPADFTRLYSQTRIDFVNHLYNVPFYPAYVDEVYRAGDGAPLKYIHHGEMVSSEYRHSQLVFTVEDNITRMTVRLNPCFGNSAVQIVLPVPVKVINSFDEPNPWTGEVVAPRKFFSFLINMLAWRMAAEYGVDTEAKMEKLSAISYNNIIKNRVKREHPQDIERRIYAYLRRGGVGFGVGGNGYTGGYDG